MLPCFFQTNARFKNHFLKKKGDLWYWYRDNKRYTILSIRTECTHSQVSLQYWVRFVYFTYSHPRREIWYICGWENEWNARGRKKQGESQILGEIKLVRKIYYIYTFGANINACLCHLNYSNIYRHLILPLHRCSQMRNKRERDR